LIRSAGFFQVVRCSDETEVQVQGWRVVGVGPGAFVPEAPLRRRHMTYLRPEGG
jgi:hypothetical protein